MNNYKQNKKFELIEVLENVAVIYQIGKEKKDVFDAIYMNGMGIYTGYILKKDKIRLFCNNGLISRLRKKTSSDIYEEFIECGFIPKHNIKKIEGSTKRKVYRRKL